MAFTYLVTFELAWSSKSSAFQKFDTHLVSHVEDPGGGNNDYHDSKPVILGRSLEILIAECITNVRKSEQWTYYLHIILVQASCTYEFAFTYILMNKFSAGKIIIYSRSSSLVLSICTLSIIIELNILNI